MHIVVYCPSCRSRYQVDPELRGQRMRCPNAACREVFEVQDAEAASSGPGRRQRESPEEIMEVAPVEEAPPQADAGDRHGKGQSSGSVGDFIPMLEAEVVEQRPPPEPGQIPAPSSEQDFAPLLAAEIVEENEQPAPQEARSWQQPPPVRRRSAAASSESQAPDAEAPVQVLESEAAPSEQALLTETPPPSRAGRRALWIMATMMGLLGLVIVAAVVIGLKLWSESEDNLYAQAQRDYGEDKYALAAAGFQKLIEKFPESERLAEYRFLEELSRVRDQVYSSQPNPDESNVLLHRFLIDHNNDRLLKEHREDIRQTLRRLAEQLKDLAEQKHDLAMLAQAKESLGESEKYKPPDSPSNGDDKMLQQEIARVEGTVVQWQKREEVLAQLRRMLNQTPSVQLVKDAQQRAKEAGLEGDTDANALIAQLQEALRTLVEYVSQPPSSDSEPSEANEPSLFLVPRVGGTATKADAKRVVLALVNGVLYGLDEGNGEMRWALRVGIDTATLPVRLAATPFSEERFLVLSANRNTLMAIEAQTGKRSWQRRLSAPCYGRPAIVRRRPDAPPRAYVSTYDGRVHEIELVKGKLLGYFKLGQPLTVGGVWQEGTDFLYVPGETDNLYVLDLALLQGPKEARRQRCHAIVPTGHPSLRSEPLIVNRVDPFAADLAQQAESPPYLIFSQTDGGQHMKLRAFGLSADRPPEPLEPQPRIRGWSWFQPYHDGEKMALVTDAGVFGLFGIKQVRNADAPLFPLFREEHKLGAQDEEPSEDAKSQIEFGQVVHAVENDFWIMANGELQRLHFDLYRQQLTPLWANSLRLGSPKHAGQLDESGATIFVVTQDLRRHIYLATAVDTAEGKIRWQRQLGLECQGEPLVLGSQVLLLDRGGDLFFFARPKDRPQPGQAQWRKADAIVDKPLDAGAITSYLLPGGDGVSAYEIAYLSKVQQLKVRKFQARHEEGKPVEERIVDLKAPLAGKPAVMGESLLLVLADGTLLRLPLRVDGGPATGGPTWRALRADEGARGQVVAIGADEFLVTDGSRGLTHWQWQQTFRKVPPENRDRPTRELDARIVSVPLVLSANGDNPLQVCVADSDGNLTLLQGPELKSERTWPLAGKITGGPYLLEKHVGCVVNGSRLVCIDPAKEGLLWEYPKPDSGIPSDGIVGEPQMVENLLVVAHVSGRFVALDPQAGQPQGQVYRLKAGAAPVAAPVAFGPGQALVPLTDGTLFLLPMHYLRNPVKDLPILPR